MLQDNGVYMSDDPYNFNTYYDELAVLSERLKPTNSVSLISNIQGLLVYFILIGPLFITNDFLLFAQQFLVWLIMLTVFMLIFSIDGTVCKVNTIKWLNNKDYSGILTCILCDKIFRDSKYNKAIIDILSHVLIVTITYVIYKMNLFYLNYVLSFLFFMFSLALKSYVFTDGLTKYKEIFRNCLREENIDIQDIVPEAENWVINRKVSS